MTKRKNYNITKLSGKRKKPFVVRSTIGNNGFIVGYAETESKAIEMLNDFEKDHKKLNDSKEKGIKSMEEQKEAKKSFYGQELQEIKDQLKDIKKAMIDHSKITGKQLNDLNNHIKAMDRFLLKLYKKLDSLKNQGTDTNELLLLLVEFNEYKEGINLVYKGIHGSMNSSKLTIGVPFEG